MAERSLYDWAEEYREKGYQTIPIQAGGKKPLIEWKKYQHEKPTDDTYKRWYLEDPARNIAVLTGSISGLVVVDFDTYRHSEVLDRPLVYNGSGTVLTGSGGTHWYCRANSGGTRNYAGVVPGLDIRGEGGYVVCPPSKTRDIYRFTSDEIPDHKDLPAIETTGIIELIKESTKGKIEPKDIPRRDLTAGTLMSGRSLSFMPATSGNRNQTAARMAGLLCNYASTWPVLLDLLRFWNSVYCAPPLEDDELQLVARSIFNRHNSQHNNRSINGT